MADPELIHILELESDEWNNWREQQAGSRRIDLSNIDLSSIHLSRADLHQALLDKTILIDADLSRANLSDASLSEADLYHADLSEADLHSTNLSRANLQQAILRSANLNSANLSGANLHQALLNEVDLIEADLSHTNLSYAILRGADLSGADLSHTDLRGASMVNANLNDADLQDANLSHADLSGVNLRNAFLHHAILHNTTLRNADLQEATLGETLFIHMDLREVKGLTEIYHVGPSNIELHTIQLPQDGSAFHFLRGIGVPDEWIDDFRARSMHPIQYYSCFISYAHQDNALAHRLHSDLQDKGVRCWFAPHDMHIGDKIRTRIDEAIHLQDKLMLILSEHSVNSDWVEHEVETALARERRDKRTILFPLRLDNTILERPHTGWAALVQNERHIGDFTGWKDHDRYLVAFDHLLRDLKKADR